MKHWQRFPGGALLLAAATVLATFAVAQTEGPAARAPAPSSGPQFTPAGELKLPQNYREWVYLSSGFDMSYSRGGHSGEHVFDNVFVNPEAYGKFLQTGTWPDQTQLVLEVRSAEGKGSINQDGHFQGTGIVALEVHIKDQTHLGGWAFFSFGNASTGKLLPRTQDCYACHAAHAAVDTTFVQFYPTLLPVARSRGTLRP